LQEVARTWKVEAMPTFVLVKDGKEVSRVIGAKKDELERKIQMFITSSSSS
jgi:thioredoxin 1